MTDQVQKIHEVIEKRYEYWKEKELNSHSIESEIRMSECQHLLLMVDSLQEESVSEDLENVAKYYIPDESYHMIIESKEEGSGESVYDYVQMIDMFKAGANWKEQQMMSKAIDGKVITNGMGNSILHLWDKGRHFIDKKVKVIVVKEE